jgi:hypothetical protein
VRFGKNIASIGDLCFEGCSNLTGVYFEGGSPLLNMATLISKSSAQKKMITVGAASIVKVTSNPDSDLYAKLCSWLFSS